MNRNFVLGVVEGFYGRPWSWRQRHSMLDFIAARDFNFYFYAPKNDPLHRNRWREPYLDEEVRAFERLARRCERLGVELCFGVSPFGYRYDDPADLEALWSKLRTFYEAGVRSFGVLLDDMPLEAAEDQVGMLNTVWELLRALGAGRLTFTPTEYCGNGQSPYLEKLGAGLDPEIDVFWTGPEVCSACLTAEHTRAVAATLRRKPLYWDNYPVNDLEQRFEAHIRPLSGRDPDLFAEARGLVAAPGPLAEAPKIALATLAEFARDPAAYDPEAAWSRALLEVAGDEDDAAALAVLGDLSRRSRLEMGRELDNAFRTVADEFWQRWQAGDREAAVLRMEAELAALARTAERLERLRNGRLRRELRPWTAKLLGWVGVGRSALGALRSRDAAQSTLRRLARTRQNFHWVMGDLMDQFARRCVVEGSRA